MTQTFQSQDPDHLFEVICKFGSLQSSDPRDKLYGLLGLLDERSKSRVKAEYSRGVDYAFYQALKVGLQEIYGETGLVSHLGTLARGKYLGYYCDARDAFVMQDAESVSILRQVLKELSFQTLLGDTITNLQWRQQSVWTDGKLDILKDFKLLLEQAEGKDEHLFDDPTDPEMQGPLFKFHARQYSLLKRLRTAGSRKRARLFD